MRYKLLRGDNVGQGFIIWENAKLWDESELKNLEKYLLEPGDLVIAMDRTWVSNGIKVSEVKESDVPCLLVQRVCRLRAKKELLQSFLIHLFSSKRFELYVKGVQKESAVPHISSSQVNEFIIRIPPLPEQRAIAACLSTWDATIQKTTQLIAQKERRKKWLMQQLLTGKRRLKGFDGEWRECHIREIAQEVSVRNKGDKDLVVLSCTKYDGLVPSLEYFGRRVFSEDTSTYKVVLQNHFAYATNHIEEGSIGYQNDYEEALISPMYTVFKTNKSVNDYFFFKLLKSHRLIHEYNARMEGSIDRRGGLRWEAFSSIKVRIPSLEEQTAIARILQTADQELQLLKAKVEKMKEQKKGMMQVLLTGRVRLKY